MHGIERKGCVMRINNIQQNINQPNFNALVPSGKALGKSILGGSALKRNMNDTEVKKLVDIMEKDGLDLFVRMSDDNSTNKVMLSKASKSGLFSIPYFLTGEKFLAEDALQKFNDLEKGSV